MGVIRGWRAGVKDGGGLTCAGTGSLLRTVIHHMEGRLMARILSLALPPALCLLAAVAHAQAPAQAPVKPPATAFDLRSTAAKKWTGDLDGMIKRRVIRVLAPYSKTFYFVDRGVQRGLVYEVSQILERDLNKRLKTGNVKVHVAVIPLARDEFVAALRDGRGDVAMGNLTITPERQKLVDFSDPTTKNVSEIVVTGPGGPAVAKVEDLAGHEVYIRRSSSFHESLEKLNGDLKKAGKAPVKIRLAPENLETEDILEMVSAGLVKVTIADNYIAEFWKKIFPKLVLHPEAAVRTGGAVGWMIRKDNPQLKAELNAGLARYPEGSWQRNDLVARYLKSTKWAKAAVSGDELPKFERTVELFKRYGDKYDIDYLVLMAQGYQESELNQNARSPVGAIGIMQVMPATGKDMKVGDINQIEPNIHAGVKFLRAMMNEYYANEPMDQLNKGLFTFAAYNAGPGRVRGLRKLAKERGLDPNVWFNNVELMAAEKIGRETVTYVSNIYKYYLAYQMLAEEQAERLKAKEEAAKQGK
jgi:membrane-bound lytic murein transglycosylase MltF